MAVPKEARILDPRPANDNFVGRRGGGGMLIMDPSADNLARMEGEGHAPVVAVLPASAKGSELLILVPKDGR